jgi:hypothetical protein
MSASASARPGQIKFCPIFEGGNMQGKTFRGESNMANCAKSIVTRGGGKGSEKGFVVPEVRLPWPGWINT